MGAAYLSTRLKGSHPPVPEESTGNIRPMQLNHYYVQENAIIIGCGAGQNTERSSILRLSGQLQRSGEEAYCIAARLHYRIPMCSRQVDLWTPKA